VSENFFISCSNTYIVVSEKCATIITQIVEGKLSECEVQASTSWKQIQASESSERVASSLSFVETNCNQDLPAQGNLI
jgi:hypothetical protein